MMWTAIQILTCVTIVLAACFIAGKRIGQRRFMKMQEEMKALEKAFNQLLEQMELVSGHNLQVLDNKTQELRELLNVTDKKCLYATDLMKEVEEMKRQLQNHNRTAGATALPSPVSEIKFRREIQELIDGSQQQIHTIEDRILHLEQDQQALLLRLADLTEAVASSECLQPEPTKSEIPAGHRFDPYEAGSRLEKAGWQSPGEPVPPSPAPEQARNHTQNFPIEPDSTALPHPFGELSLPLAPPSAEQNSPDDASSVIDRLRHRAKPSPSSLDAMQYEIVQQVLDLYDQGVSIPQIARQMKMSKSEVELMMKCYDMRKAV